METLINSAFAQILEANRSRFNARFAEARRFRPRLDPAVFSAHLRSTVAPIVEAVNLEYPEKAAEMCEVLYDLSLDLLGQEFLGPSSRYPFIAEGWSVLLPRLSRFMAESPRLFAGSVTNALYNLSITPGARPHEWVSALLKLAEVCPDALTLLKVGQVLSWRAGLAHYRSSALEICKQLDPPVAYAALGLSPQADHPPLDRLIASLQADPWLRPDSNLQSLISNYQLRIVAQVGAFRGFGGLFLSPPTVAFAGGNFVVRDGEDHWLLTADIFGATLHRTEAVPASDKSASRSHFQMGAGGRVKKSSYYQVFPELETVTSSAANSTTLAVTTPLSHSVYLIALVEG